MAHWCTRDSEPFRRIAPVPKKKEHEAKRTTIRSCLFSIKKIKATGSRLQAAGSRQQAVTDLWPGGSKREGGPAGRKLLDRGAWIKFYGPWIEGLGYDEASVWMGNMERYLMGWELNFLTRYYFQLNCKKSMGISITK